MVEQARVGRVAYGKQVNEFADGAEKQYQDTTRNIALSMGLDPDSAAYGAGKITGEIASMAIPGGGALKAASKLSKGLKAAAEVRGLAATGKSTTILGENMVERVMPFAEATGARALGFGATAEKWASMTPRQRYKLNDGMLRARINEGDSFRYIGKDPHRPDSIRQRFDLTRSELLRLEERGVPYEVVSLSEVFSAIGRS